jgi:hypothetical protein
MHLNKLSKDVKNKIIAGMMAFVIALGIFVGYKHQTNKINDLKKQLELKQELDEQSRGYTESILDVKTIKGEFNKLKDYPILKNYRITMTHTYDYLKYGQLGIKRKATLSGSATCIYDIDIRLSNANIFVDNKNVLHVELEEPFLNKESVHLEENTFLINERKSDMNFWMKKEDAQDLMRYWSNSFNTSAVEKLEDLYNEEYQREKLNAIAKQEVGDLLRTLKVEKFKITIK